jgi:hypothetical protein
MFGGQFNVQAIAELIVGALFSVTAVSKWLHLRWFIGVVRDYNVVPAHLAWPVGLLVVVAESATAAGLLVGTFMPWPAYLAAALLLLFTVAIARNLLNGKTDMPCGCTGPSGIDTLEWSLVSRNIGFVGLALLSAYGGRVERNDIWTTAFFATSLAMVLMSPWMTRFVSPTLGDNH